MAEEVRNLLKEDRNLKGREVYDALKAKFPGKSINEASCGVAFSTARQKLGITKKGKKRKGAGSAKKVSVMKKRPAAVDLQTLEAAAKYLASVGDSDKAIAAVKQVQALQVK